MFISSFLQKELPRLVEDKCGGKVEENALVADFFSYPLNIISHKFFQISNLNSSCSLSYQLYQSACALCASLKASRNGYKRLSFPSGVTRRRLYVLSSQSIWRLDRYSEANSMPFRAC